MGRKGIGKLSLFSIAREINVQTAKNGKKHYGAPAAQAPVLYLQNSSDNDMASSYLDSFEQIWAASGEVKLGHRS